MPYHKPFSLQDRIEQEKKEGKYHNRFQESSSMAVYLVGAGLILLGAYATYKVLSKNK